VEVTAVENLKLKGQIPETVDATKLVVDYVTQGKNACVTIAQILVSKKPLLVVPGWAKYNLNDAKREKHHKNPIFGHMLAFTRALRALPAPE
jgi:hypothetical protein